MDPGSWILGPTPLSFILCMKGPQSVEPASEPGVHGGSKANFECVVEGQKVERRFNRRILHLPASFLLRRIIRVLNPR